MRMNTHTGTGASAPSVAGYSGKYEDRKESSGNCPWCCVKGQTNALRLYAINLQDTVELCTNPVCLYPLVSRPLEDVLADLCKESPERQRNVSQLPEEEKMTSPFKRAREESPVLLTSVPNSSDADVSDAEIPQEIYTHGDASDQAALDKSRAEDSHPEELLMCTPAITVGDGCVSSSVEEVKNVSGTDFTVEASKLVPVPSHLFWKNTDNLCWLDSMLAFLVNCKSIRETPRQNIKLVDHTLSASSNGFPVWSLCSVYDKIHTALQAEEQKCTDASRVPLSLLLKAEQQLSSLRLSVFRLLQPTLRCDLGQMETPVFALPLLLRRDAWAQALFQHTLRWEFQCTACGYATNERVESTLTTFTQIVTDWHPLRAQHRSPCNNCNRKNQRRKMVLERSSSVFALHFVEGFVKKDLSKYSFQFQGSNYQVSAVIQYIRHLQHFVTWIRQSNGAWLELDDFKNPYTVTHKRLSMSPHEIHIVFWEADDFTQRARTVHSTLNASPEVPHHSSVSLSHWPAEDTGGPLNILTDTEAMDSSASGALNASIGITTPLEAFEDLSHTDIVTLTLVEVNESAEQTQIAAVARPAATSSVSTDSKREARTCAEHQLSGSEPASQASPALPSRVTTPVMQGPSSLLTKRKFCQSTPLTQAPRVASKIKPCLTVEINEALPVKSADMFAGFLSKNPHSPTNSTGVELDGKVTPNLSPDKRPLSTTEALRLKLMKKLKAKKKKLAKLNKLLGSNTESTPKPDSTAVCSPYSITSSTSTYEDFFSEFLSPGVSYQSPDSTGQLESQSLPPDPVPTPVLGQCLPSGTEQPEMHDHDFNLDLFF